MVRHSMEDVIPGMVAGREVRGRDGTLLAPAGGVLVEAQLRAMRAQGVRVVDIVGQDGEPDGGEAAERLALAAARCRQLLLPRFQAVDREGPLGRAVFELAVDRAAARAVAEGLDLAAVADAPALPSLPPEEQLFDHGGLNPASLVSGEVELATLPEVFALLLEALCSETASAGELAGIIGRDPSLAAKLLRLVNSPLFGSRAPVESIDRAVALVGHKELATLVTGLAAVSAFADIAPELYDMGMFWRHAASCAVYASLLAQAVPGAGPDRAFVGGLLHDLGQLVILRRLPAAAGRALLLSRVEGLSTSEAEIAVLGFDHAAVGQVLLAGWNFPPALTAMVADHHQPDGRSRETAIVHFADVLAQAWVWPAFSSPPTPRASEAAWRSLGLSETVLATIAVAGDARIAAIESLFMGATPRPQPQRSRP